MNHLRIGNGFDVHAFTPGRKLILGGVTIDYPLGLAGHSDADVLVHSIIDSFAGVGGFGDIGRIFPDTDPAFRDIDSLILLSEACRIINEKQITLINTDSIIICEKPKLAPHIDSMRARLAQVMEISDISRITIKATTSEKLGFTGRGEGIAVMTVSLFELPG